MGKHAVFVCCDGLGAPWVTAGRTPVLHALGQQSLRCTDHRAVFPSVTRVSAASIATGCHPARHGLHGNRMALPEAGAFAVRDVGKPDFREHMRRATGATLKVPTLAERTAGAGASSASPMSRREPPISSTRSTSASSITAPARSRRAARASRRSRCRTIRRATGR